MATVYRRRSLRLRAVDYAAPGAYFVTLCSHGRRCVFGEVVEGTMAHNDLGRIATDTWNALPRHYPRVALDAFAVMPNHVHGVIVLLSAVDPPVGAGLKPAPTRTVAGLPEIVRAFKTFSARRINDLGGTPGVRVWQRSYYERIVRDEAELNRIRQYVAENPLHWDTDTENPAARPLVHAS